MLVFKTFWRRLEDLLKMPSRCLGRRKLVMLKTSSRCLEDVLKTCLEDLLKTYLEDVFKTSWKQTKYLLGISVSNKSKCVSNKSIFHKSISDKSKANPKCVTYNLIISIFIVFWNKSSISILGIKISEIGEWANEAIKTKF